MMVRASAPWGRHVSECAVPVHHLAIDPRCCPLKASHCLAGYEVLSPRVMADDCRGGLFGLVLPAGVLIDLDTEAIGAEQLGRFGVVFQVRAGGIAPGVPATPVLLTEQTGEGGAVFVGKAELFADPAMPIFRQRLGHLNAHTVQ